MINPKVVFILESISQPRCIKRINSFISGGFDVDIYGIDRGKYNENATISGKQINIIGNQTDGDDYFNKLINNNRAVKNILKSYNSQETIFYSFGFSLTLSLKINGCKNYVYEISDILYGYNKFNLIRPFFKKIDKYLIKKALITVLTSDGFGDFLFNDNWPDNIIIQPNRLNAYFRSIQRSYKQLEVDTRNLRFAYVGAFRYPNTIFRFAEIIGEHFPKYEFHFYGDSKLTEKVIMLSKKYNNVKYFGSFKNPDDLESIYNNFDIVVACYDIQSLNERIAEPNKLYEALFFNKPIIVSKNTFLSDKVKKLNCGYVIDASNNQSIISFLDSIETDELNNIRNNISTINNDEIIDDESARLISLLKEKYYSNLT